jgi:hypothetical protein
VIQPCFHGTGTVINIYRTCKNDHICAVNGICQRFQFFIIWAKLLILHNTLVTSNAEMPEIFWQKKLCHFSTQLVCQHFSYMISRTFMILPMHHCDLHKSHPPFLQLRHLYPA